MRGERTAAALDAFAREAEVEIDAVARHLELPWFGAAWDAVERLSPRLKPAPVARASLARRIAVEERSLSGQFGEAFQIYRARRWAVLPPVW